MVCNIMGHLVAVVKCTFNNWLYMIVRKLYTLHPNGQVRIQYKHLMGNLNIEGRDVSLKVVYFNQQHHFGRDKHFAYSKKKNCRGKNSIGKLTKLEGDTNKK